MRRKWTDYVRAFSALTLAVSLSACQNDYIEKQQVAHEVGFYAGGSQTRTTMLPDGLSAVWETGDQLAVWARDSSGSYELSRQIFKAYGLDKGWASFKSDLTEPMREGTYTYLCCYPVPLSINGTKATFDVPAVQDGKVGGGADIMIATPAEYGPLREIPDPDDMSGLAFSMNHMLHQFRFYIPGDNQVIGNQKLERILLTFPGEVCGKVTLDLENFDSKPVLADATNSAELKLSDPLGISSSDIRYACFAFVPQKFEMGQSMQLKAYTSDKIAYFDPIDLSKGQYKGEFMPGHSTPVKLNITRIDDFAGILTFTLNENNLGENPDIITFTAPSGCSFGDGGTNVYVYNPGREIPVGEKVAFKFESDFDAYKAFSGKDITISYDSDNAVVTQTVTVPSITQKGTVDVPLTVPYLLFEDFSCVFAEGESYGNNSYDTGDEREQPGNSLDGCMTHTGWSAARYWTTGNAIRINTRYQVTGITWPVKYNWASTHYGRLDTSPLSCIKSGKTVEVMIEFDAGGYIHQKSSLPISNMSVGVATHDKTGVIDGIPAGSKGVTESYETTIADIGSTQASFPLENNFGETAFSDSYPTLSAVLSDITSSTRICFYPNFSPGDSGDFINKGNVEFNVYIDNIKIKIAK